MRVSCTALPTLPQSPNRSRGATKFSDELSTCTRAFQLASKLRAYMCPFLVTARFLSLGFVLLLILPFDFAQAGTSCKCRRHNAEAEATGTCSRTEDSKYCTLKFSATPPGYREVFVEFIDQVNDEIGPQVPISTDVNETLNFAFRTRPSDWDEAQLRHHLPLLFAISQREIYDEYRDRQGLSHVNYRFRTTTFRVARLIDENARQIMENWRDEDSLGSPVYTQYFNYAEAEISYGCIQLNFGDGVETMVKTRFSLGGYFCTDTDPELYHNF